MRASDFAKIVRERLSETKQSLHGAAVSHGLPRDAMRNVLDGHIPRLDRAIEIASALGLDFHIATPRGEGSLEAPQTDAPQPASKHPPRPAESAAAIAEAVRKEVAGTVSTQAEALREEIAGTVKAETQALRAQISRLRASADGLDDPSAIVPVRFGHGFGEKQEDRHVELVQLDAAAGAGAEVLSENMAGTLAFCWEWMSRHGLVPRQCRVIGVKGDSMQPTLWDGGLVMLDYSRTEWKRKRIYVLNTSDGVVVKRAGEDEAGNWLLVSDNKIYEPVPFRDDTKIIGQVVWTSRTLIGK